MDVSAKAVSIPALSVLLAIGGWMAIETVAHGEDLAQHGAQLEALQKEQRRQGERFDKYIETREQADANQDSYNERVMQVLERLVPTPTPDG
jgi:hypothetical protein